MTDRKFIMLLVASSTNNELFHHKYYINFHCLHGRTGLILFGGGTVLVCPTALLTQYTYTTLFEILSRPFLRIFLWGAFFEKGPSGE
jgi:hypothetical protein